MSHYFTDNTEMHHDRKEISFRFLGIFYSFMTDAGVFSKDQVDFGTQVLLTAIADNEFAGKSVLDLGCGYGVISIVLKKMFDMSVTAVDINPRSVELTKENALKNETEINAYVSDGIENEEMYDNVVTNPPIRAGKEVIYRFFTQAYDHLNENGCLWVVIRKQQGAESAQKKIKEIFGNCEAVYKKKGYVILKSKKLTK